MKERRPPIPLSQDDLETLFSIREEFNAGIQWGALAGEIYDFVMSRLYDMAILGEGHSAPLLESLLPSARRFVSGDEEVQGNKQARVEIILRELAIKALGATKTRVRQRQAQSYVMEDEVVEGEIVEEETVMADGDYSIDDESHEGYVHRLLAGQRATSQELATDADSFMEIEGMDEHLREISREAREMRGSEDEGESLLPKGIIDEVEARLDLSTHCEHFKTRIKVEQTSEGTVTTRFCRACRQFLDPVHTPRSSSSSSAQSRFKPAEPKPYVCPHKRVSWKAGQEGKVAVCSECKGDVPDPSKFRWVDAGLEPFGDDPSQDEVIELP